MITALFALAAAALPPDDAAWTRLADTPVPVECVTVGDLPWCRASGTSRAGVDRLAAVIEARDRYPDVYEGIGAVDVLDERTFRLVLDLPAMLADRDSCVAAERLDRDGVRLYRWRSVVDPRCPEIDGVIRLRRAAGEWRLAPTPSGTELRYTWSAEMRGHLPTWVLHRIWAGTGLRVIRDTLAAVGESLPDGGT